MRRGIAGKLPGCDHAISNAAVRCSLQNGCLCESADLIQRCLQSLFCHTGVQDDFQKAAADALKLPETVKDADKLILYGLYKQATVGDNTTGKEMILSAAVFCTFCCLKVAHRVLIFSFLV